jgi:hypothetical protein
MHHILNERKYQSASAKTIISSSNNVRTLHVCGSNAFADSIEISVLVLRGLEALAIK